MAFEEFWYSSGAAGGGGYSIGNSLRFRGAQHLEWTTLGSQSGSQYCMSVWVKRGELGGNPTQVIWSRQVTSNASQVAFGTDNQVQTNEKGTDRSSNARYRDTAGWCHLFWKMMDSDAVNANSEFYVNGVLLSEVNVVPILGGNPPSTTRIWNIGRQQDNKNRYFTGYMANFQAVVNQFGTEGIAIPDVTDFGEFDVNGVWIPKQYGGAYGNQGVYLDFSDPANIGADRSGNGNNFTATGFELSNTSSTNYDWMEDSPTQNYATLNPLLPNWNPTAQGTYSRANMMAYNGNAATTIAIPTGVQIYVESQAVDFDPNTQGGGWGFRAQSAMSNTFTMNSLAPDAFALYKNSGGMNWFSGTSQKIIPWPSPNGNKGQIANIAIDRINKRAYIGFNGTYRDDDGNTTTVGSANATFDLSGIPDDEEIFITIYSGLSYQNPMFVNCGQAPFANTVPTGFKALQTQNLPSAPIANASDHFTVTLSGTNIKNEVQAVFPNSIVWIKPRDDGNSGTGVHRIITPQNGADNAVEWPSNHKLDPYVTPTSNNNVAWTWNVPDTFTGTNIIGNGYRNVAAGVSTVNYAGTGTPKSIAHGLGKKPDLVITRMFTSNATFFATYVNVSQMGASYYVNLNGKSTRTNNSNYFPTEPDANVFNVGSNNNVNESGKNFFALCFTSIPGFSSFGEYVGNGDNSNGPFINLGFRPALLLFKRITSNTSNWIMLDSTRDPFNPANHEIRCNLSDAENTGSTNDDIDFLSNGFKLKGDNNNFNNNNSYYIYFAWAENPFGGSNVSPVTAR